VSESTSPSIIEIRRGLAALAKRIGAVRERSIDPCDIATLMRLIVALEAFIPGLDEAPDSHGAAAQETAAQGALMHARPGLALSRALHGLSLAPHHPGLHHLVANACLDLGWVREATRILLHVLWIHPGHVGARSDLDAAGLVRPMARGDEDGWSRNEPSSDYGSTMPIWHPGPEQMRLWFDDEESGGNDGVGRRAA
jgi:hypothetical protein